MAYTGITRLKLNTESGEVSMGSGTLPTHPQGSPDLTQADVDAAQPISFDEFTKLTMDPRYKSNPMDFRSSEAFRRQAEAGFVKWQQQQAARSDHSVSQMDTAALIMRADPSIPHAIAAGAVQNMGGFATREERARAYSDPRYKESEDYRAFVASRDAITEF